MIDTDKYMEMLDDNLLDSEDVQILVNTLYAEVEQLRGIIDYIRDTGRMRISNGSLFLSIMEKVLTTEEYLEWRNKE